MENAGKGVKMIANAVREEMIIAGFGGQGIVLAGKLLAQTAMNVGREVTFIPSYGAEVRGGTSNCSVVVAEDPIASPVVSQPDSILVLNKASFVKFEPWLKSDGLLVMNTSLIESKCQRDDITVVALPASNIATQLQSPKSTNMVMLGAYLAKSGLFEVTDMIEALPQVLAQRYHNMLEVNAQALRKGAEAVG